MDEDRHTMFWEDEAQGAIESLVKNAEFDDIRGTINLPSLHDDGFHFDRDFKSIEDLQSYLIETYDQEWHSYVPFERGEAVFEGDSWNAVSELLDENPNLYAFFDRNTPPDDVEALVTANELLLDTNASRSVRVSLEEINEDLIEFLAANPSKMREMTSRKFEELVADMFRSQGYEVTLTPASRDGGMDVIAVHRDGIGTSMIIVECKRYAEENKVGVGIARGLYGVVEQHKATKGIIATTSFFTKGTKEFRETVQHRLGLADFNTLQQEIQEWKTRIDNEKGIKKKKEKGVYHRIS